MATKRTKQEILQDYWSCLDAMDEYANQETKALQEELREARELIESLHDALHDYYCIDIGLLSRVSTNPPQRKEKAAMALNEYKKYLEQPKQTKKGEQDGDN